LKSVKKKFTLQIIDIVLLKIDIVLLKIDIVLHGSFVKQLKHKPQWTSENRGLKSRTSNNLTRENTGDDNKK
jgi:hypothetical protein